MVDDEEPQMPTCFVIQPFDNDKFDRRFTDVFAPSIKRADLIPYRVDKDPSVNDIVQAIHKGIDVASACLVDITLDNPNVWYELGVALAVGLPHCICCSEERSGKFPFDVSHLKILHYKVGSKSDFESLESSITERLKAIANQERASVSLASQNPRVETEGLSPIELMALVILFENQFANGSSAWSIQQDMERAGFTKAAANLAMVELLAKGFIEEFEADSEHGNYRAYRVAPEGLLWIRNNKNKIVLRYESTEITDDDIPF